MNVIPGYGVRGLVVDDLDHSDGRTSYDIYTEYLSEPTHLRTHLDHSIFYLASSLYHVEFIIVALMSHGGASPLLYHRRINMVAKSRRTIVVSHSFEHYNLLDIKPGDTTSLSALLSLPQLVQTSRYVDRDWCRWKALNPRQEDVVEDSVVEEPNTSSSRPLSLGENRDKEEQQIRSRSTSPSSIRVIRVIRDQQCCCPGRPRCPRRLSSLPFVQERLSTHVCMELC